MEACGMTEEYFSTRLNELITMFKTNNPMCTFADVLLSETDPYVINFIENCRDATYDESKESWVMKHVEYVGGEEKWKDLVKEEEEDTMREVFPMYKILSPKARDAMLCKGITRLPDSKCRVVGIGSNLQFMHVVEDRSL